jgi:hypothetical protein
MRPGAISVRPLRLSAVCLSLILLAGCGTWSTQSSRLAPGVQPVAAKKAPADITLSENDITERPYRSLGDIKVTVHKATIFDHDPTRAGVDDALRERAAELGADAVVLVRYGTVGIGALSWGQMDGNGRAVAFQ